MPDDAADESIQANGLSDLKFRIGQQLPAGSRRNCGQTRNPLLSWRVAVLPYLGQQELYNSFKLDEPWDSPHNKKLIEKMPAAYTDDSHPELVAAGKTTFLVPSHPSSIFPPSAEDAEIDERANQGKRWHYKKGVNFADIKDGTSQTLLVIEVPSELAVPWTKRLIGKSIGKGYRTAARQGESTARCHRLLRWICPCLGFAQ